MPEAATVQTNTPAPEEEIDVVELKEGESPPDPANDTDPGADNDNRDADRQPARAEAGEGDDEDPDKIRKERRHLTRERSKEARNRERIELELMRRQNAELANRLASLEGTQRSQSQFLVNGRLEQAQTYKRQADIAFAEAVSKGDASATMQAQQHQQAAAAAIQQLQAAEHQIRTAPAPTVSQPPPNPVAVRMAQKWADANPWYDPQARDPDSRMVAAIDLKLTQEGYDPGSAEYYEELDARAAKVVPDRYGNRRSDNPNRRRDMPSASSSEGAGSPGKVTYYVTPGRKKAMQDSGQWDDPKKRAEMLKYYQQYDKANPPQRR